MTFVKTDSHVSSQSFPSSPYVYTVRGEQPHDDNYKLPSISSGPLTCFQMNSPMRAEYEHVMSDRPSVHSRRSVMPLEVAKRCDCTLSPSSPSLWGTTETTTNFFFVYRLNSVHVGRRVGLLRN